MNRLSRFFAPAGSLADPQRLVPPTGMAAVLTVVTAGAMAFLAVFALALMFTTDRLAQRWSNELARTATVRISAPAGQIREQVARALEVLNQTDGVAGARALETDEKRALLTPWFGPDLPLDSLPVPELIEIRETGDGFDAEGLRLRLRAEVPGAILDDHTRWRRPLVEAAERLGFVGLFTIVLITGSTAALVTLAATASLAVNGEVIRVLRLIGARDTFVARAFVRRFTLRAVAGAAVGTVAGMATVAAFPDPGDAGFLPGLGFSGTEWFVPLLVPLFAGVVAFLATRFAALRKLREIT